MTPPEFKEWPKIPRWSRGAAIVTEKIDGTNAIIHVTNSGDVFAGSRNRWLLGEDDNFGFRKFVEGNKESILKLGSGYHYGEWWGLGIQRGYGLKEKRLSLFNVTRHEELLKTPGGVPFSVVPVLATCSLDTLNVEQIMSYLKAEGSKAAPGFMNPEGIIVFNTANRTLLKKTFENDKEGKGQ